MALFDKAQPEAGASLKEFPNWSLGTRGVHRCKLVGANLVFALHCLNKKNKNLFPDSP